MTDSRKTKNIFIIVTNRCNLHCIYCYEQGKNTLSANEDTMRRVLEYELQDNKFDSFDIVFHGGEPFIEWTLVRNLSEWLWEKFSHRHLRLMATTNGTLLSNEMKQWLSQNNNRFQLILSLDGGRDTHNRNRCNSFDRIDFDFFLSNWPEQRVKMTVNPTELSHMFEDIMEIREMGFRINPSLAMEVKWDIEIAAPIFTKQLELLIGYYMDNPDLEPCPLINLSPALLAYPESIPHNKACGAGTNIIAYDMNGNRYPCHSFICDFNVPYNKKEIDCQFDNLNTKDGLELSPCCKGCFIYPHCEPCYGMNYSHRGGIGNFDSNLCVFNKIRVKAAAAMYAQMILSGKWYRLLHEMTDQQLKDIIMGIQNIQENL